MSPDVMVMWVRGDGKSVYQYTIEILESLHPELV